MPASPGVLVIGAGIIGVNIALALQRAGHQVTVLDREGVAAGASQGNAGAFAFAEIEPLAAPGVLRKAPKWLCDPLGPLSIPPAYALTIAPWMLRFWRASRHYAQSLAAQAQLMRWSQQALQRQIQTIDGTEALLQREGQMQLFEGEREFRASLQSWALREEQGIDFTLLHSPEAIAEIQPGVARRFTHAGFTPQWVNTCDPAAWTEHLAQQFIARGGRIERAAVHALTQQECHVLVHSSQGDLQAPHAVIAAGAWSRVLAQTLGDQIPLETERGYNTTLPAGAFDLRTHLTFGNHGFVASKIAGGVRIGGAVELGGLDLAPNFRRAEALLHKASQFLPSLNTQGGKQWMGFRPSLPDSLPVIDRAPRASGVIYAFGHGHLGLTQAAGTAELVTGLIRGDTPPWALAPFAATRFGDQKCAAEPQ